MQNQDPKGTARRRTVSERLRKFFAELTAQLTTGTAEIWTKVEQRLAQRTTTPEATRVPPSHFTQPMQQQPLQQQQTKAEPKDGEKS